MPSGVDPDGIRTSGSSLRFQNRSVSRPAQPCRWRPRASAGAGAPRLGPADARSIARDPERLLKRLVWTPGRCRTPLHHPQPTKAVAS